MPIHWTWNDGWILAAAYAVQKEHGATLPELIGAADALNQAIPTAEELSDAMSQFVAAGVMRIEAGRFIIAADLLPAIARTLESRGGVFSNADKCTKWLKRSGLGGECLVRVNITAADVAAAQCEHGDPHD